MSLEGLFGLPWWLSCKESSCQCRRCCFNPWVGRSPGEGNGNPLQYPCLENPMDKGAWWATVHGVTKSQTRLSDTATTMRGAFCPSFNQKSLQVLSLFLKIIMTSLFGTVIVYYSSLENKPKNQHKLIKIMAQGPHSHGVGPIKALPQCAHACAHLHGCASANTDTRGSR